VKQREKSNKAENGGMSRNLRGGRQGAPMKGAGSIKLQKRSHSSKIQRRFDYNLTKKGGARKLFLVIEERGGGGGRRRGEIVGGGRLAIVEQGGGGGTKGF